MSCRLTSGNDPFSAVCATREPSYPPRYWVDSSPTEEEIAALKGP